ncbi:hypothetical protein KKH36_00495 [Patescibacteria group bacterium]|nr:hypothetical protein [Patescibacteria group bacterium]
MVAHQYQNKKEKKEPNDPCPNGRGKNCCRVTGNTGNCRCGEGACGGADVDISEPPFNGKKDIGILTSPPKPSSCD